MSNNQKKDRYSGVALLIFGIILYFFLIPNSIQVDDTLTQMGPDFFPRILAILLIILSLLLIFTSFSKRIVINDDEEEKEVANDHQVKRPWAAVSVFLLMIVFVYIAEPVGFLVSSLVIMLAIMAVLLVKKWYLYVVMIIIIFLLKYFFENLMFIQLP